jgi:hypothetical protein
MGLFSSVIHVRHIGKPALLEALDAELRADDFVRAATLQVPTTGPGSLPDHEAATTAAPYYLVGELEGDWLTIIEAHLGVENAPWGASLCNRLSARLSAYVLSLMVHDDDVFMNSLDENGEQRDGYNSNPLYFEEERLSDEELETQRHTPEAYAPLLPAGVAVPELKAVLDRGWWAEYDAGTLDEDGSPANDDDFIGCEERRMTAFGRLLRLHGRDGEYPYTAWAQNPAIAWDRFTAVRYARA